MLPDRQVSNFWDERRSMLHDRGFVVISGVIPASDCNRIAAFLEQPPEGRAGSRALLRDEWYRELGDTISRHAKIAPLLAPASVAVQCTLFEKSPDNNWLVAFHQDQSIPVADDVDASLGAARFKKDGLTFAQPPAEVLAQMLAVRLQIDPPEGSGGALRVIPGSHRHGRLTQSQIASFRSAEPEVTCEVGQGGVLVMRPLLLHASSKIIGSQPRRVLHFLFGPTALPRRYSF